jgi:hypothetical protein
MNDEVIELATECGYKMKKEYNIYQKNNFIEYPQNYVEITLSEEAAMMFILRWNPVLYVET